MRVTNSMLVSNSIWNIGNNAKRLDKAQQQESTQSKIQLPSDDPEVATQAVKYRNYVSSVEQYQKNAGDATSWMKVTEGAISDLHDVVQQVRDKTVEASTGTMTPANLAAIKQEVGELKKTAIQILNNSYAGRYIFAGYDTDKAPYAQTFTDGSTTVDKVTFKGKIVDSVFTEENSPQLPKIDGTNYYKDDGIDQSINYNIGFNNQITVNVEGQDVVGTNPSSNLFATFDKLMAGLEGKTSYQTINANGDSVTTTFKLTDILGDLDTDLDRIGAITSNLGARENTADLAATRLSDDHFVYTKLMAENEDVGAPEATTNVSTAKVAYEASLAGAAKAISKSLLDYIS